MLCNRLTFTSSRTLRLLAVALWGLLGAPGNAAEYNVPAGDVLALVDALDQANAAPGYDKIVLEPGLYNLDATYDGAGWTALPVIESYIEITTAGGATATIRRDPMAPSFRLFEVASSGTLRLNKVMLRGGATATSGGAIYNEGTVVMLRCIVLENSADTAGAIYSAGSLSIDDSTLHTNESTFSDAGAIRNDGNAVIKGSLFRDNFSSRGGGAIVNTGYLRLDNTTLTENVAEVDGGAIVNTSIFGEEKGGDLWLQNVTVVYNVCDVDQSGFGNGGGIDSGSSGKVYLRNTLIANNEDHGGEQKPDCEGQFHSFGYNLIEDMQGWNMVGDVATNILGVDPMVGVLSNNGGPTQTHALLPGSPAIDTGNAGFPGSDTHTCEEVDQRGYSRPADGDGNGFARCDIGAFELYGNRLNPPSDLKAPEPSPQPGKTLETTTSGTTEFASR